MEEFDFVLRLNRMPDDEQIEALFDAGCGDGTFSGGPSGAVAEFHREPLPSFTVRPNRGRMLSAPQWPTSRRCRASW